MCIYRQTRVMHRRYSDLKYNINILQMAFSTAKGKASAESAGYIAAIANQVAKLEPNTKSPIITLENDNQRCIIQTIGPITGAIYKKI